MVLVVVYRQLSGRTEETQWTPIKKKDNNDVTPFYSRLYRSSYVPWNSIVRHLCLPTTIKFDGNELRKFSEFWKWWANYGNLRLLSMTLLPPWRCFYLLLTTIGDQLYVPRTVTQQSAFQWDGGTRWLKRHIFTLNVTLISITSHQYWRVGRCGSWAAWFSLSLASCVWGWGAYWSWIIFRKRLVTWGL